MSVTAKPLFNAQFAAAAGGTLYTCNSPNTAAIIDKFTATNTDDSGAHTITVSIVPNGGVQSQGNQVIRKLSIAADTCADLSALQNQILSQGDSLFVTVDADSKVVVRASGREVHP